MTRISLAEASRETFRALLALDGRMKDSLGPVLYDLVKLRASQINGCAYCVDMHSTDLEKQGLPSRTIHGVAAWQDNPFFDETQRVVLAFTEALAGGVGEVPDDLWEEAGRLLGDQRRADLLVAVGVITTWNIASITAHLQPAA
jgi:AhpD family alkylhydroperoxidase